MSTPAATSGTSPEAFCHLASIEAARIVIAELREELF